MSEIRFVNKTAKALKIETPKLDSGFMRKLGNMAKNHFLEGWRKGGYMTDNSQAGWAPRKRNYHYEKRGNKWKRVDDTGKAILVQSGTLRRTLATDGILSVSKNKVVIGVRGVRYAAIHNFGLQGKAFGKYPFKMPRREFVGHSRTLERKLKAKIENQLKPKTK